MHLNCFSSATTVGYTADYNIYDLPGGNLFSGVYNGSSLQAWRTASKNDMNSLVYTIPFVNPATRDFHINQASPAAWAVNGRAEHDTVIKTGYAGTPRPLFVADGVPDLGAFEVTPTSTPPNADATPASPVANSPQVFTFGQDTVGVINWGPTVPAGYAMRQYTGVQAASMPVGVGRMYFYVAGTPSAWTHAHQPRIYYKEPWVGDIPGGDADAVIARSGNSGAWEGYNYINAATDTANNILMSVSVLDSIGSYTGVQNGRIGIRCVEDPKGIVITNVTATEADINWLPVFNPIGYQVVIKTLREAPSTSEWGSSSFPTTNSLAASGLIEDTKYYVYVRSVCGVKDTSGYTLDSFTTLITCHDPVITVTGVTDSRAIISWTAIKTAAKYEYFLTKSDNPPAFGTDISKNSVLAPFLDAGTTYYVHVRAHCSSIYPNSNWVSAQFSTGWPAGVNDVVSENGLAVYPNPAHDELTVQMLQLMGVLQLTLWT